MDHYSGNNYHFFFAHPEKTLRLEAEISPFYPFSRQKIEDIPQLVSDEMLLPAFLYNMRFENRNYPSRPIYLPEYIRYDKGRLESAFSREERPIVLHTAGGEKMEIQSNEMHVNEKPPFIIQK